MAGLVVTYDYTNDIELLDIVLQLYAKTFLRTELSNREHCALREYILNGYSAQTKKHLIQSIFLAKETDNKNDSDKLKAFNKVFKTKLKTISEINTYIAENDAEDKKEQFLLEYKKQKFKRASLNLNVINYALKEKGFLDAHPTNQRLKVVSEKILILNKSFLKTQNDDKLCLIIDFKNQSISKKN